MSNAGGALERVAVPRLRAFVEAALTAAGALPDEAEITADVLVTADRFGIDTHGVQRMRYYVERLRNGVIRSGAPLAIVRETATTAVVDGGHGFGQVVAKRAMSRAIEKAARYGVGCVAVRNSNHYGIAGYYPLMAAQRDMIGFATTNARPCLAPTNGTEPSFGTNPIAFAAPSDEAFPFLFDAAVSIWQRGTLEVLAREGREAPEGIAIDEKGRPVTDPAAVLRNLVTGKAAMLPLGGSETSTGGHKGYGLAIAMEILSAALQDGCFLTDLGGGDDRGEWAHYHTGHFFLALDANAFAGADAVRRTVGAIARTLRASRRADPAVPILTAGEKEWRAAEDRDRHGVPISPPLAGELAALASELGVSTPLDPARAR